MRKPFIGSSEETWDLPAVSNRQPEMFSREVAHNITAGLRRRIQKSIFPAANTSAHPAQTRSAFGIHLSRNPLFRLRILLKPACEVPVGSPSNRKFLINICDAVLPKS